jgi:hypothetical protein
MRVKGFRLATYGCEKAGQAADDALLVCVVTVILTLIVAFRFGDPAQRASSPRQAVAYSLVPPSLIARLLRIS